MARKKKNGKKPSLTLSALLLLAPGVAFFLVFGREVLKLYIAPFPRGEYVINVEMLKLLGFLVYTFLFTYLVIFLLFLFVFSVQSILPTISFQEICETFSLALSYAFGMPGRVARVIGGELVSSEEKLHRKMAGLIAERENSSAMRDIGGVIVQDSDSACVLEKIAPEGFYDELDHDNYDDPNDDEMSDERKWFERFFSNENFRNTVPPVRVCGPGLVFIKPWERVHSFVDLRKQIRSQSEVVAMTGDGIEVKSFVFSVFSLGREPKPLQLAFTEGKEEENLQIVNLELLPNGRLRVTGFDDSLAEDDQQEAFQVSQVDSVFGRYFLPKDPGIRPKFNRDRVFGAVYARARGFDSSVLKWDELPVIFTVDAFREVALQYNYDALSNPLRKEGTASLIGEFKGRVNAAIRNQCVLSYSVVLHESGKPLERGGMYAPDELRASVVRYFTASKVLRDSGVMNIFSAFTQIIPCEDTVYAQRLENWRARLQREIDMVVTSREIEVRNIVNRARIQAQDEISSTLNGILGDRNYSEEAMAFLLFQALEEYVSDPETRNQLPNDVITLLRNLQDRILPPGAAGMPFLRD